MSASVAWPPSSPAPGSRGPPKPATFERSSVFDHLGPPRSSLLPSLGPSSASGLASNAFRRSAAHYSGMYATPAPFFTLSCHGSPSFPVRPVGRPFSYEVLAVPSPLSTPSCLARVATGSSTLLPVSRRSLSCRISLFLQALLRARLPFFQLGCWRFFGSVRNPLSLSPALSPW